MPNTNSLPLRPYQQRAKEQIHTCGTAKYFTAGNECAKISIG